MNVAPKLFLIAGLSKAGKSTFADLLEQTLSISHVPLDRYFHSVPAGSDFLSWVQSPSAIDWKLLNQHLKILADGHDCFSPAYDAWGSGQRLSEGGDEFHVRGQLMKPSTIGYSIPGCLAFEYPNETISKVRIFIDTPLQGIASRHAARRVLSSEVDEVLGHYLTPLYAKILAYKEQADIVIPGDASDAVSLRYCHSLAAS
jgi:uridine kinase